MRRFGQHHRKVTATLGLALVSMAVPPLAIAQQIYVGSTESGALCCRDFEAQQHRNYCLTGRRKVRPMGRRLSMLP